MWRNNKGFSLVELIVALAIFGIAGVAVFGFMVNSSRLYQRTNVEVKLQYEQQLAVNQIRDMVVESDKGIYFDETSKTLALYGTVKEDGGTLAYPVTVVRYVQSEQKMYYGIKEFASVTEITVADVETPKLLAENVTDFKVDLTKVKNDKVTFEVTFMVGDKEQKATETVALRNRLVVSNQVDTIWGDMPEVVDSFIREISIFRDGVEFENNGQDTIGKADSDVKVVYSAKVIANEDSDREYKVSWDIEPKVGGVSVDINEKNEGIVTVKSEAQVSTPFHLIATSVDDPSKFAEITITITNTGVYPESIKLEVPEGNITEGNGFRTYKLVPTVTYSDGSSSSDYKLFTWAGVDGLPAGCTFNKENGVLTVGPSANGKKFDITVKAKGRKADGSVLSTTCEITIEGIKEYVPQPSVKIVVGKKLSRGGNVFPTMVFENATHTSYTYNWKIEPCVDENSDAFTLTDNPMDTSRFKLVSLAESGDYSEGNARDTMETGSNRRSVTINCATWLDWNKTFKIKVSGTATDRNGNVLVATPAIVTIEPVKVTISRYGGEDIEEGDKRPVLTRTELMHEDWYWDENREPETENGKWAYVRRWFNIQIDNLTFPQQDSNYIKMSPVFVFTDATGLLINNIYVSMTPYQQQRMLCGFKEQFIKWEQQTTPRPAGLTYAITYSDNYRNSVTSNGEDFKMIYEFYYPETYNGGN